jgi:lysozyme
MMQSRNSSNVNIIDVSHHQGTIDWGAVAAYKINGLPIQGVIMKASEGVTGVDDKLIRNVAGAKGTGLATGYYHYAHPERNEPEKEAQHFFRSVWGYPAQLPLVLDVEGEAAKVGRVALTKWCLAWLQEVKRLSGHDVMIYTGASFARSYLGKELAAFPLWVAHYGANTPMANGTWDKWSVFQYSSTGRVDGISGNVDMNVMDKTFFDKLTKPAATVTLQPTDTDNVKVVVNDKLAAFGRNMDGHIYLPLRKLGEALGKSVHWDNENKLPYVDGKAVETFSLIDNVTYVGVRAAAELLGGKVSWDGKTKKVYLYH